MLKPIFVIAALSTTPTTYAVDTPSEPNDTDTPMRSSVQWDVTNSPSVTEHFARLVLGLTESTSASVSATRATDGAAGMSAGLLHQGERGWLGVSYKTYSVSNDYATQSIALDSGRSFGQWQVSFMPRYTQTRIYGQVGGKQSSNISAPGVSLGLSHHTESWSVGGEYGTNFYNSRLDSLIKDSRSIGKTTTQSGLVTTGLEQSYWSVFVSRYYEKWEGGVDYLSSVSAVDLTTTHSLALSSIYYLSPRWDLRVAWITAMSSADTLESVSVGAKYYW